MKYLRPSKKFIVDWTYARLKFRFVMWKTFFFLFFLATSIYLINKRWAVFYSHFQLIQLKRVPNTKYESIVCKKLFLHLQRYKANVVSSLTVSNKLSANFCQTWTWTKYQIKAFILSLNTARTNLLLSKQTMDGCMNAVKANNIFTQSYSHSTTHSPTTILSKCAQNTAKGTGMIIKFNMRKKEESTFSTTTRAGFSIVNASLFVGLKEMISGNGLQTQYKGWTIPCKCLNYSVHGRWCILYIFIFKRANSLEC